ncbi:glycosyltransferase [Mucilaginibacter aquaedulcis]|uniref:glycosyltransferase n=1 Tax=Mucilaginibacter aquaedulcis TaxID=1187081 RepID=UPI0025B4A123|nr:glycosyltransferase [Mucilaginibacter aquaedulcis]MDN3548549.1 glycosyltransferase [Mucilaginibacter aquaedulcis]
MRVAIIGTRGIPNYYGASEQCAAHLAAGLVKKGYEVVVYSAHDRPYQAKSRRSVFVNHQHNAGGKLGIAGRFIYQFNCIKELRKKKFDIVLHLGYTTNSLLGWFLPKNTIVTTNISEVAGARFKHAKAVWPLLKLAEKMAVKYSDFLIANSAETQKYIESTYRKKVSFINYGVKIFDRPDLSILDKFKVKMHQYDLLVAPIQVKNNIETILDGVVKTYTGRGFLVVGNTDNNYGIYLRAKFQHNKNIMFCEAVDNIGELDSLRYYSNLYFHEHTAGYNKPVLLEAMASNSVICSADNEFNRAVLGKDAFYFSNALDVAAHLLHVNKTDTRCRDMLKNNEQKIKAFYSCDASVNAHAAHFESILAKQPEVYQPEMVVDQEVSFS